MFIPLKDHNPTRQPAVLVILLILVIWFALQFLYSAGGSGIGWLAHVGGFVLGFLLVKVFAAGKRPAIEIVH